LRPITAPSPARLWWILKPDSARRQGRYKKIIPADQSSGKIIAGLLPEGAELVKAFGTLRAESLGSAANRSPERARALLCDGLSEAGRAVAKLIAAKRL